MTAEEFASDIQAYAVNGMVSSIRRTFSETPLSLATDPHWLRALAFYSKLDEQDREVLIAIVRHASASTASRLLGYLDGEASDGFARELLVTERSGAKINGDLQSDFLVLEERRTASQAS